MISKARLKILQSLKLKKFRQKYDLFIVEGQKSVNSLIERRPELIETIYCTDEWAAEQSALPTSISIQTTDSASLKKASQLKTAPPVIAICHLPKTTPIEWTAIQTAIYLDDVQDPGNVGTIIRIADWYGVDAIIRSLDSADFYSPKVIQSTMGSFAKVPLYAIDKNELHHAKSAGLTIISTQLDGSSLKEAIPPQRAILIMGNEGNGTSPSLQAIADSQIAISGAADRIAESLNVAVTTGILVHWLKN